MDSTIILSQFLDEFKDAIARKVVEEYPPAYSPAQRDMFREKAGIMLRSLYPAQLDTANALTIALRDKESAIVAGEMGTGKTIIGIAVAHFSNFKHVLVMCPPHLVKKWAREIESTLPNVEVLQLKNISDIRRVMDQEASSPGKQQWYILSRERAKLSYQWKPAFLQHKSMSDYILRCPACGQLLVDKDGILLSVADLKRKKHKCIHCREPLWQANNKGPRRYALAELIKKKHKKFFDLLVIDECLPPETIIATEIGPVPIKTIVEKRLSLKVWSRNDNGKVELKPIVRWIKRPGNHALLALENTRMTPNHKVWTAKGYKRIDQIQQDDVVCYREECSIIKHHTTPLPNLWIASTAENEKYRQKTNRPKAVAKVLLRRMLKHFSKKPSSYAQLSHLWKNSKRQKEEVLLSPMWSDLSIQSVWSHPTSYPASQAEKIGSYEGKTTGIHLRKNAPEQSYETTRSQEKIERNLPAYANPSTHTRRQWQGIDKTPADTAGCLRMANRMGRAFQKALSLFTSLQARPGLPEHNGRNRNPRAVSQQSKSKKKRLEEARSTEFARMDSTLFYKPAGIVKPAGRPGDGYVYNLEVADNHNYFANGLLVSNCHEYKGRGTSQGFAAGALAAACKKTLALTGTLFGGYSSTLFHLLYRLTGSVKKEFAHNEETKWISQYGIIERVTKKSDDYESNLSSRGKRYYTSTREKPGLSPAVLPNYLLDRTVFIRLSDLTLNLPPYREKVMTCPMAEEQSFAYYRLARQLHDELVAQLRKGNKSLLSIYLQSLLSYPDRCYEGEMVLDPRTKAVIADAPALDSKTLYPKEEKLIDICCKEKREGRKVLVYATHTDRRDITGRLKDILERHGLQTLVLKSNTIKAEQREEWIKNHLDTIDILIVHPRLVQTGLDLVDFPTIVFQEVEYSVYTLRQASRRSWRIGQTQPVKVYYLIYEDTIQEQALKLIALKHKCSLAIEGELLDDGLAAYNSADNDFFYELARNIVDKVQIDDSIDSLWAQIQTAEQNSSTLLTNILTTCNTRPTIEELRQKLMHSRKATARQKPVHPGQLSLWPLQQ